MGINYNLRSFYLCQPSIFSCFYQHFERFYFKRIIKSSFTIDEYFIFLLLSVWIYNKKYKLNQFLIIISPLLLMTYLSLSLDVWVERIHFIEYAVLGLLISRAVNVLTLHGIIYTGCLVTLIGAVDEIIQWFLPNRVGDMRDVFMNSVGGLSGLWLGKFLFWEKPLLKKIYKQN